MQGRQHLCSKRAQRHTHTNPNPPSRRRPLSPPPSPLPVGGAGGPKLGSVAAREAGEGFSIKALSGGKTGGLQV